jgi:hypothetical protein
VDGRIGLPDGRDLADRLVVEEDAQGEPELGTALGSWPGPDRAAHGLD